MIAKTPLRIFWLCMAFAPGLLLAGVHKCLDGNGKIVYQDKPCQDLTATGLSPALSRLNPEENRPHLLWKLTAEGKSLYLLGALGYGTADMYPLPEAIMDAFAGSNVLVVAAELDAGDEVADQSSITAKGGYTGETGLQDHVKPNTWRRALQLAQSLGIKEEALNAQRPWLAALTLKSAAIKQAGYDEKLSVGNTFVKAAETLKPIVELDPLTEQLKRFDDMADADQEPLLLEALHEADNKNEYFKSLAEAWKKGDPDSVVLTVRRAVDSLPPSQKPSEQWLNSRNEGIANKIDEMAADGRTYFLVVDEKRLVGEKGILAMLQAKGFKAAQL
jgi:uncharacterized protein YbaP (TraB family)